MWLVTWAARSWVCRITELAPPLWINHHPNPWVLSLRWYVHFIFTDVHMRNNYHPNRAFDTSGYIQDHFRWQVKGVWIWPSFTCASSALTFIYYSCCLSHLWPVLPVTWLPPNSITDLISVCLSLWHCVNPDLSTDSLIHQTDTSNSCATL